MLSIFNHINNCKYSKFHGCFRSPHLVGWAELRKNYWYFEETTLRLPIEDICFHTWSPCD